MERWKDRLQLSTAPSALLLYLGMNTEDARLRDPRVRRALALAIDRERIIRTKLRGKATLASSLLPPFHWAFHEPATSLAYNPEQAKRLLDEAGFPDPDGPGAPPVHRLRRIVLWRMEFRRRAHAPESSASLVPEVSAAQRALFPAGGYASHPTRAPSSRPR